MALVTLQMQCSHRDTSENEGVIHNARTTRSAAPKHKSQSSAEAQISELDAGLHIPRQQCPGLEPIKYGVILAHFRSSASTHGSENSGF